MLDRNFVPLSERLVFINHHKFEVPGIATNRNTYLCRDSVVLEIDLGNEDFSLSDGQYSLSVFDSEFGSSIYIDEPDIISSAYLKPEIKGEINDAAYYFNADDATTNYNLDLLLLTQGWRKYSYYEYMMHKDSLKFPENRDVITGNVKRLRFGRNPKPARADVRIYFSGTFENVLSDEEGRFSILPEFTQENLSPIVFTAKDMEGSDNVKISVNYDWYQDTLKTYLESIGNILLEETPGNTYVVEDINRTLDINTNKSIWIDEVEIRRNITPDTIDVVEELFKTLENVKQASPEVISTSNEIWEIIMGMGYITEVDYENDLLKIYSRGNYETVKFIVDGFDMGSYYSDINGFYKPDMIKSLYVARGIDASIMYDSNVVVFIKTDNMGFNYGNEEPTNSFTIPCLMIEKEFYSPGYETSQERNMPIPDIRKTMYWDPHVTLDEEGKARIVFYNSDRYTSVKCILEGFTDDGIPIHEETGYNISIHRD